MLYDPKWEQQAKVDPFELSRLIAWLKKQPASGEYCYTSNGCCLIAMYLTAQGFEDVSVRPRGFRHGPREFGFPRPICGFSETFERIAKTSPWTFGAALKRARAAAKKE